MQTTDVFLATPERDSLKFMSIAAIVGAASKRRTQWACEQNSLLCFAFNALWCTCLNDRASRGYKYFAMLHADVYSDPGWLDLLIDEMEARELDVLSAVVCKKELSGQTSTAVRHPDAQRAHCLTLRELADLPATITPADVADRGRLLINTGCWVCRLDRPWVEEFPGFAMIDQIVEEPDGRRVPLVVSEDWLFSEWLAARGVPYGATRIVKTIHRGDADFSTAKVYGD